MEELIKYFTNLLIIQYRNNSKGNKSKLKRLIESLANVNFKNKTSNNIFALDVENAYNLNNAVGVQLDVIGKYVGFDRYLDIEVSEYFRYEEYDGSALVDKGYSLYEYEQQDTNPYAEYRYAKHAQYALSDSNYRKILNFILYLKTKPLTLFDLNNAIELYWKDDIYVVDGDKTIEYHVKQNSPMKSLFDTLEKYSKFITKYFPKPMGCEMSIILD